MTGPRRAKNAWFLGVTNVLGVYQVDIGYKTTKNIIQPFSTCKKNAYIKRPFGPPVKGEYRIQSISGEEVGQFKFVNNRNENAVLPATIMNNLLVGVNNFSRKVTDMYVNNKRDLLVKYLSSLLHSDKFVHHNEETHNVNGFRVDGSGVQEPDLVAAGGSLEDFRIFINDAKESATEVASVENSMDDIRKYFATTVKRKANENIAPTAKLSRNAQIEANEKKELEDDSGLEVEYKKSFVGMTRVPLANIKICPGMESLVNQNRVEFVMSSIRKKFDPSLNMLVIITEEQTSSLDLKNAGQTKFFAVQKLHTLQALKNLEKTGEFSKLFGHEDDSVFCFVLNTNKPEMLLYGNQRSNDISSQFTRKTRPQDLMNYFHSLMLRSSKPKAMKVVERMAKLSLIGPDEITAVSKMCQWSMAGVSALMEFMEAFENYQTLDVKPSGHQSRLGRGEKMTMTNVLFKRLGKCSEQYFVNNYQKVLDRSLSLKMMLDGFEEMIKVQKVCGVLSVLAGNESYTTIKEKYPVKFDYETLKNFVGANIKGQAKNAEAKHLEEYYISVTNDLDEAVEIPVTFEECPDISSKLLEDGFVNKYDVILVRMMELNQEKCSNIIRHLKESSKLLHAALLIFSTENDHFQVLSHLRSQNLTLVDNFKIIPVMFTKEVKSSSQSVVENLSFSILLGKFSILKPPLHVHYNGYAKIKNIVECISPPRSNVAMLSDPGTPLTRIDSVNFGRRRVSYFASKDEIEKLKKMSGKDKSVGAVESEVIENPSGIIEIDGQDMSISLLATGSTSVLPDETLAVPPEVAEDSTSPVKSSTRRQGHDDSGYFGGPSTSSGFGSSFNKNMDDLYEYV